MAKFSAIPSWLNQIFVRKELQFLIYIAVYSYAIDSIDKPIEQLIH